MQGHASWWRVSFPLPPPCPSPLPLSPFSPFRFLQREREREAHRIASRYQHPPTAHTVGMTVCVGVFVTSDRQHHEHEHNNKWQIGSIMNMNTTTNGRATQV